MSLAYDAGAEATPAEINNSEQSGGREDLYLETTIERGERPILPDYLKSDRGPGGVGAVPRPLWLEGRIGTAEAWDMIEWTLQRLKGRRLLGHGGSGSRVIPV